MKIYNKLNPYNNKIYLKDFELEKHIYIREAMILTRLPLMELRSKVSNIFIHKSKTVFLKEDCYKIICNYKN